MFQIMKRDSVVLSVNEREEKRAKTGLFLTKSESLSAMKAPTKTIRDTITPAEIFRSRGSPLSKIATSKAVKNSPPIRPKTGPRLAVL